MNFYCTIDLDFCDDEELHRIASKISSLQCCEGINIKPSNQKGYHLLIWCKSDCDLCRLVFDDQRRFERDSKRPKKWRNVLFDDVEVVRLADGTRRKRKRRVAGTPTVSSKPLSSLKT